MDLYQAAFVYATIATFLYVSTQIIFLLGLMPIICKILPIKATSRIDNFQKFIELN